MQDTTIKMLMQKAADERQEAIMKQLTDLTSRGLLVVEVLSCALVHTINGLDYQEVVKVTLKDQEYIEALERENAELRAYRKSTKRNA